MPSQRYALEPNGPLRLTLSWSAFWKNFAITLDEQPVGGLTAEQLKAGADVPLPDGSTLHVQLRQTFGNAGLELSRNGAPLPGAANDPATMVKNAAWLLYALAALNALLGGVAVALDVKPLVDLGLGVGNVLLGFVFAVCGYFTLQRSLVALGLAIALYVADGLMGVVLGVRAGASPGVAVVMRVVFVLVLARGVTGLRALKVAPR